MASLRLPNHRSTIPLLTMMLILIGCATAPTTGGEVSTPSSTAGQEVATPATQPEVIPTPISPPTPTLFVPKDIIKIVTQSPLSGNLAIFGIDIARGAELAVGQLSGALTKAGYQVELSPYDDRNNIETALANAAEILADPEALCVIGHYGGRLTMQAAQTYHSAGLALISPSAENSGLTEFGYLEVNRIIGRRDAQGRAGAQFAEAQGFTSVYIVAQKDQDNLKNADSFKVEADRIGLRVLRVVILEESVNPDLVVADIVKDNPQLVYFAGTADQAIPFFQKARAAGYTGTFLGLDDLNNPSIYAPRDSALVEGGGLYFTIMSAPSIFYPGTAKFIQDFDIRYGESPLLYAARAYDAAGMCVKAIENASKEIGGGVPTRAQVAKAIRAMQNYQGITGTYNFNEKGDATVARYFVYKVVSLSPANWDQNSIVGSYEVAP